MAITDHFLYEWPGIVQVRTELETVVEELALEGVSVVQARAEEAGRDPALRARLSRVARRRGVETLHRLLRRHDPESAQRIQPRDEKRLIRALEVYRLTGRPLTDHFASTRSPIADYAVVTVGLQLPADTHESRIARRVDQQFVGGLLDEIRGLLVAGVPPTSARSAGSSTARRWSTCVACGTKRPLES